MKIHYAGTRPSVSTVLSNRGQYYFGPENNFTLDVVNPDHIAELLRSVQHRFEVVAEAKEEIRPREEKVPVIEATKEPEKEYAGIPEKPKKRRGRRKKNA